MLWLLEEYGKADSDDLYVSPRSKLTDDLVADRNGKVRPMIIARLTRKIAASDGKPFLAGPMLHDVKRGTLALLRKDPDQDDVYLLVELGSRKINTDKQTLLTWSGK